MMQQYQQQPVPSTMPPRQRHPFDLTLLPPEMQVQLAGGQPVMLTDGSTVYPDGTSDVPHDDVIGPGMDMGFDMGGYGGELTGQPGTMPPMMGGLQGPQFERFNRTANAPFPGTPGGIGGGPLEPPNPMGEAMPTPFEVPEVTPQLTVEGPRVGDYGGDATKPEQPRGYGGRIGRKMTSRQTRPAGRPASSRRRR